MPTLEVVDDRKRKLLFGAAPSRVVSLVPSDTFTVAALGCAATLVGRTDYCELPADVVAKVPSVGGTKNPRVDAVLALEPDLVLANQEENTQGDLEALAQAGVRVLVAFPRTVAQGAAHLARLARVFRVERDAPVRELVGGAYDALRRAEAARTAGEAAPLRTFCPIWMEPLMTVHEDTYISDALRLAGAENVFATRRRRYPLAADLGRRAALEGEAVEGRDTRYPRVTWEEVVAADPELVLLPDEPHPFTDDDAARFAALDVAAARSANVVRTPGKDVCWHGAWAATGLDRLRALVDDARARARTRDGARGT